MSRLESSWVKLTRAVRHVNALQQEVGSCLDPTLHPVRVELQLKGGSDVVAYVAELPALSSEALAILGDAAHNFRSSLDHLAWQIVLWSNGERIPEGKEETIAFPLAKSPDSFVQNLDRYLPGVGQDERTIIRRYQPYQAERGARALELLRLLSDTDKHRHFVPVMLSQVRQMQRLRVWAPGYQVTDFHYFFLQGKEIRAGTPVFRAKVIPLLEVPSDKRDVQVEGQIALYPSFERPRTNLWDGFIAIGETVTEILTTFVRILAGVPG